MSVCLRSGCRATVTESGRPSASAPRSLSSTTTARWPIELHRSSPVEDGAPTGIRTLTGTILSRLPLPIGLWGRAAPSLPVRSPRRSLCRSPRSRIVPVRQEWCAARRNTPDEGEQSPPGIGRAEVRRDERAARPWDATRRSRRPRAGSRGLRSTRRRDAGGSCPPSH